MHRYSWSLGPLALRLLLFKASLEWLKDGKVNGTSEGELRLGY